MCNHNKNISGNYILNPFCGYIWISKFVGIFKRFSKYVFLSVFQNANCSGKLLVFHSTIPNADAPGKLPHREGQKLLGTEKQKVNWYKLICHLSTYI